MEQEEGMQIPYIHGSYLEGNTELEGTEYAMRGNTAESSDKVPYGMSSYVNLEILYQVLRRLRRRRSCLWMALCPLRRSSESFELH
jgi:hypothetical protein